MAQQQPARRKMQSQSSKTPISIPDKLYFRIGDVARLCSLPAYVLRFWETEFPQLKPNKGGTGQRLYRKRDVEIVLEIKRLLYDDGFTIAGARRLLTENRRTPSRPLAEHIVPPKSIPTSASSARSVHNLGNPPPTPKPEKPSGNPRLKDLRKEMREILSLLGTDHPEPTTLQTSSKRDAKKVRKTAEEPTLF